MEEQAVSALEPSSQGRVPVGADWLLGGGEMGKLIRARDWSTTPLGPIQSWPESLRTTVRIVLAQRFPMLLWWGPQYIQIYNDAYVPIPGAKHPQQALGVPVSECWSEIWHILQPLIDTPFRGGPATWMEDIHLDINRHGFMEETHFTIAYSPVPDESVPGGIGGVLATVHEITEKVIGERRIAILRHLGAVSAEAKTAEQACEIAARTLSRNGNDVPFALLYVTQPDGEQARLAAAAGISLGEPASPICIDLRDGSGSAAGWPLGQVLRSGQIVSIEQLASRFERIPAVASGESPHTAVILPMASHVAHQLAGFLVAGVSPHLRLDEQYRSFLQLAASQIAATIANSRAYEEERKRAEALAAIDLAKTTFFTNVSHEFRTPLTLMLGPIEDTLADGTAALDSRQRERLVTAHRNSLRLLKLVNTLLDFSRIEAGRAKAVFEPVDIAAVTAELASNFRSACERAGLRLIIRCETALEPVFVDRDMWEKIVLNLLSNAFKFTLDGEIEVALSAAGDGIELRVRDTGTGIPTAEMAHLFERFHRVHGVQARSVEGTGIGLALVQELVKLHGGSIRADSVLGQGTVFSVRLPFGKGHLPADQIGGAGKVASTTLGARPYVEEALRWLPAEKPAGEGSPLEQWRDASAAIPSVGEARPRVLWADDNADMREYVRHLLEPEYDVIAVADGEQALRTALEHRPELVLTDVMMPRMDGFGLLKALRADPRTAEIPVIMVSARAGEDAKIEGLDAGTDDYLVKPFSGRELLARVRSQLTLAAARKEIARERERSREREELARRQIELQQEDYQSLFMQAPNPIVILHGPEYIIALANLPACRLWGGKHEDVINKPLFDALPELREQIFKSLLDNVIATGAPHEGKEIPANFDYGDGRVETVYFNFVCSPLHDAQGHAAGVLVVAFDVTDEVMARNQMVRLRSEAESANRTKDEFLAMLGHELRNPLSPMLTALQIMRLRGLTSGEQDILERQVAHLTRLVDDLLDVSRITRGRIELRKQPIELAEAVTRAVEMANPLLEQRTHRLEVHVARQGLAVEADLGRLAQVLSNLLTNAAKYSDVGSRIVVGARLEGGYVRLSVKDEGIGIATDMLGRVFDLFVQQAQSIDRSRGGLGLGLAIARNLVELHDGTLTAYSQGEGKGSEFVVEIPVLDQAALPPAKLAVPSLKQRLPLGDGKRVLVVDDNGDAASTMKGALLELGYSVAVAGDGPSALELAKGFQPEIALVDIGLPLMDGYELASRLRALLGETHKLTLIAVTGYGLDADRQRSNAAGFEKHLVKPVDIEQLLQVCR